MKYKGYTGQVEFDEESGILFGRVIGLRDVITFEADSGVEVIPAFHDSVDDYLALCAERGESPERPYSGQFVLRLDPRLHRELANVAQARNTSLNTLIEGILAKNVQGDVLGRLPLPAGKRADETSIRKNLRRPRQSMHFEQQVGHGHVVAKKQSVGSGRKDRKKR
jgi:predicted HicB family RNase H-like nuclease